MCKLAKYVRNCVVLWKNLHSWQKIYTTAGRDGRDKFQVCLGTLLIIANITSVSIVTFITFLATLKMVLTLVRASFLPFGECVAALHWSNVSNRSSAALGETLLGRWRRGNVWSKWEWGGLFDDHRDKKWSTGVLKVWFLQKNIYLAASPPAHPKSFSGGNWFLG